MRRVPACVVAHDPKIVTYTYNGVGQVTTVDGPRTDATDVTTTTYTPTGDVDTVTDAVGNATRFTAYDGNGRPISISDANGTVTTLTYDARGLAYLLDSNAAFHCIQHAL